MGLYVTSVGHTADARYTIHMHPPVRMVAIDVDGTLLSSYVKGLTPRTARALKAAVHSLGAKGVERLVRNSLWRGRPPEQFYDALEWLYGWSVAKCLAI